MKIKKNMFFTLVLIYLIVELVLSSTMR